MPINFFSSEPLGKDIDRNLSRQIEFFDQQGNTSVADTFRGLQNERNGVFWSIKSDVLDQYDAYEQMMNPAFREYLSANKDIASRILPQLDEQAKLVKQKFGPEWEFVWQANAFFNSLINATNSAVNWQVAGVANQAQATWSSQSAINAAINRARNSGQQSLSQIQWEKLSAQQQLLRSFIELEDKIRWQQFDAENELIRNPILQLNQRRQELWQNIMNSLWDIDSQELSDILFNQRDATTRARTLEDREAQIWYNRDLAIEQNALDRDSLIDRLLLQQQLEGKDITDYVWSEVIQTQNDDGSFTWIDWVKYYTWDWEKFYKDKDVAKIMAWTSGLDLLASVWNGNITWYWSPYRKYWLDVDGAIWDSLPSPVDWTVVSTGKNGWFWNTVVIEDKNWVRHQYAHLDSFGVQKWQKVTRWQSVWTMWNTWDVIPWRGWDWSHLDYTVYVNWKPQSPQLARKFLSWLT